MKNNRKLIIFIGIILVVYGQAFRGSTLTWSFSIIENIKTSINTMDSGQLLLSSFAYIFKSLLTYIIIYFGSLLVVQGVLKHKAVYQFQLVYIGMVLLNVFVLNRIYSDNISFLTHVLSLGLLLFLEIYIPKKRYYYTTFLILLVFVLGSMLWLNVLPSLSKYGFGTEDIAVSLKIADRFLSDSQLSTTLFSVLFVIFLIIAAIFTVLVSLYNKQIITLEKYQNQAMELEQTKRDLVETKVYQEIHTLVHDLKSPLATVEGLTSLMNLKYQQADDQRLKDYFYRLDTALGRMNEMISEILYEDIKSDISIQKLLDYVISHMPLNDRNVDLELNLSEPLPLIRVNKIRFARAISNIIENSIVSLQGEEGKIEIAVEQEEAGVVFTFKDNGTGIEQEHIADIWKEGFSKRNSSGLGLSFVKRVVENHDGHINVSSGQGYTEMYIFIPIRMKEGVHNDSSY